MKTTTKPRAHRISPHDIHDVRGLRARQIPLSALSALLGREACDVVGCARPPVAYGKLSADGATVGALFCACHGGDGARHEATRGVYSLVSLA
jgi:hypothetical protein